jgi:DNA damage-inducible protein 1
VSDIPLSADLIRLDVFPDMTFNDIKALIQGEINVAPQLQHFFYNQRPVTNTSQTLTEAGLRDGDLLGMAVRDPNVARRLRIRQGQDEVPSPSSQRQREGPDTERMRLHIVGDPRMMAQVRNQDPELADAAHNRDNFHAVWNQRQTQLAQARAEKEEQLAMLNADPFNAEAQARIAEMIQQEGIQENIQKALEDNPECKPAASVSLPVRLFAHEGN